MASYIFQTVSPTLSEPFTISFKLQMGHQQLTVARPSQDYLDIVATQGAYLIPRSNTPVWEKEYDEKFAAALDNVSDTLDMIKRIRRAKYHEAAEEWPIGFTPPEVKERRLAELRAIEEMEDITTDEGSDGDDGGVAIPNGKARVEKARPVTERASQTRLQEAHGLPTPLSGNSPLPMPQGTKRRHDEEKEYPRKTPVISPVSLDVSKEDMPDGSPVKGRKRRRTDDVDAEEKGDKGDKGGSVKDRKRRRTDDVDEEEKGDKKDPVKNRKRRRTDDVEEKEKGDKADPVKSRKRRRTDDVEEEEKGDKGGPVEARKRRQTDEVDEEEKGDRGGPVKCRKRRRTDDVDEEEKGDTKSPVEGRKRRRTDDVEEKEKGDKKGFVKDRRRRRTDDIEEEEKGDMGGTVKARKIAALRREKKRPPKRPKAG